MIMPSMLLYGIAMLIVIVYLPAFFYPKKFQKTFKDIMGNKDIVRVWGVFLLLLSFLFLSTHWEFADDYMLWISLIGWAMFVKGVLFLWFPELAKMRVKSIFFGSSRAILIVSAIAIIFSGVLVYIGYNFL